MTGLRCVQHCCTQCCDDKHRALADITHAFIEPLHMRSARWPRRDLNATLQLAHVLRERVTADRAHMDDER